jgi:hypothetical protein
MENPKTINRSSYSRSDPSNTFSPGQIIRGKITIEDYKILPKIRKVELNLGAIEFVQAQGKKKRTEIYPNYKEKIE